MTVTQYIQHHHLVRIDNDFLPSELQCRFKVPDDVEYYGDGYDGASSKSRIVGICYERNYAVVYRQQTGAITTVRELNANIPDLNKST